MGNNLEDSLRILKLFLLNNKNNIKYILYQFNFNDIPPYSKKEIVSNTPANKRKIGSLRYKYLQRSVFFRKLIFYRGLLKSKKNSNLACDGRGILSLDQYSWSYGSKGFEEESKKAWIEFGKHLNDLKKISDKESSKLFILVSPLLTDVDRNKTAKYFNHKNLDFNCATINPRKKLNNFANENNIDVFDPTIYIGDLIDKRNNEGNFKNFYFPGDLNHFKSDISQDIANYLYSNIFGNFSKSLIFKKEK